MRPSIGRRWLRRLGLALLLASGAMVALVLAIDLGWQRGRILGVAESLAEARLGTEVSLGRSVGRLWRGVELQDVLVGNPEDPLIRVDSLELRWNILSLLSREQWTARSIRIEDWTIRLRRSADGRWGDLEEVLAHLAEADVSADVRDVAPDSPRPRLHIQSLELGEGTVILLVERRREDSGEHPDGVVETPLRAQWRGSGTLEELAVGPDSPLRIDLARFDAVLSDLDSGVPDFDRAARAKLSLSVEDQELDSLGVDLSAPGLRGSLRASGTLARFDRLLVDIDASDIRPLGGWVQAKRPISGELRAHADLSGSIGSLEGALQVEARGMAIESVRARELDLDLELEKAIDLRRLEVEALDARFELHARGLDPGALATTWIPPGEAQIDLEGEIDAGRTVVRRAQVALAGLTLSGTGDVRRDRIESFDMRFGLAEVGPWVRLLRPDLPLEGAISGKARLAGAFDRPHGTLTLHSDGLGFDGRELGALDLSLSREPGEPASLAVALDAQTGSVLRGRAELDLERERVDFEVSSRVADWLSMLDDSPAIEAELQASGFVQRTESIPRFAVTLHSSNTIIEALPIGRLDLEAHSPTDDRIEISSLEIEGKSGSLTLRAPAVVRVGSNGTWSLPATPIDVSLADLPDGLLTLQAEGIETNLERLDVRLQALPVALANRFAASLPPLSGSVSGEFGWTRERRDDWLHGELEWRSAGLGELRLDRFTARWRSTPAEIDVELETDVADRSPLAVEGRIVVPDHAASLLEVLSPEHVAFEADLNEWSLAALEPLTPRTIRRVEGRVSGSVRVDPARDGPRLSGRLSVSDGGFTVPLLRQRFEPIEARLSLEGRRIDVESLRVGREGADAELVGSILLPEVGGSVIDGSIRLDHLPLSRSSAAWADLLGEVRLSGSLAGPIVRGDLSLEEGRIGVPEADDPILKEIRIASSTTGGAISESEVPERTFRDGADLDLTIRMPPSTRIRGQGANLWVEGEMRILKPALEPHRILGEARVVNGTYRFQGRRFRVQRGRIRFTGDERLDPLLDIDARLPVADIVAIVDVSGRLSSPVVRLLSEPSRDERDVLSYIVFGRPADEIGATSDSDFDAAAARLAAGVAETELHDLLGDAMPIDTIEVEADEAGNTSAVGFGKFIGPKLFLRYVHVLSDEPVERVGVEYRLNDTFSIGSSVSSTGDAGLDLILRYDF